MPPFPIITWGMTRKWTIVSCVKSFRFAYWFKTKIRLGHPIHRYVLMDTWGLEISLSLSCSVRNIFTPPLTGGGKSGVSNCASGMNASCGDHTPCLLVTWWHLVALSHQAGLPCPPPQPRCLSDLRLKLLGFVLHKYSLPCPEGMS